MGTIDTHDYQKMIEQAGKLACVLPENYWVAMERVNQITTKYLTDSYRANVVANIRNGLWAKHGPMAEGAHMLGRNKAVISIGAGASLNNNKTTLAQVSAFNSMKHLDHQPFMVATCNHSFKWCIANNIHPHFVGLIDGTDVVYPQLCQDVPASERNTILLTGLHASPKVLEEWDRQGRAILFHVGKTDEVWKIVKEETGEDTEKYGCEEGGNVMNSMWIWAMKVLGSTVHMAVGNDLAYPLDPNYENRCASYYADKDYSSNLANKRDEAKYNLAWMGFEYEYNPILARWVVNFKPMATSYQLWTYKKWLEMHITLHENDPESWHYYNCSESGILGVLANEDTKELMMDRSNWKLLDEIVPKRYHTRRLQEAIAQFLKARDLWADREEISPVASVVDS